jgi:hypothetical protein
MQSEGVGGARAPRERQRPESGARVPPMVVVAAALVAFVAGAFTLGALAGDGSGHAGHAGPGHADHAGGAAVTAQLGGLALQLETREWVNLDMLGGPTPANAGPFKMPMTGIGNMPAEGIDRFHVELLISNQGDAAQALGPDEFRLHTPDGKLWSPNKEDQSDEDQGRKDLPRRQSLLTPGQMTDLDLFFDLPEKSGEPVLLWSRANEWVSVTLGAGVAPQHQH